MNINEIEEILRNHFNIDGIEIIDDSISHQQHKQAKLSGGGHFILKIISRDFQGLSALQRHRMVNDALKDKFQDEIHALSIKALTPNET